MNHLTIENNKVFKCDKDAVSVTIPEGVMSIGNEAFSVCSNLQEITISKNITGVDEDAFKDCSNLKLIKSPKGLDLSKTGYPKDCVIEQY